MSDDMTRAEHLLTILAEECAEVAQRVSKTLRFGPLEIQPGQPLTNAERVNVELTDLLAVVEMLREEGVLPYPATDGFFNHIDAKKTKVEKFLVFSAAQGTVDGAAKDSSFPHPEAS